MLINSVVTSFIAVITLLGFFHQPINNGFQKWISREQPTDPNSENTDFKTILQELNAVKSQLKEQVQQQVNAAVSAAPVQSQTSVDPPIQVTTTSHEHSNMLHKDASVTSTESHSSKDSLDEFKQLKHELDNLKVTLTEQIKQSLLLQSSTQQPTATIIESQEGDAQILENKSNDLKISTSIISLTSTSSATLTNNDRAAELAD